MLTELYERLMELCERLMELDQRMRELHEASTELPETFIVLPERFREHNHRAAELNHPCRERERRQCLSHHHGGIRRDSMIRFEHDRIAIAEADRQRVCCSLRHARSQITPA